MGGLLDARPLIVQHQDGVVDELVGLRLAHNHFVQRAVDILDDEIDRSCGRLLSPKKMSSTLLSACTVAVWSRCR